MFLVSIRRCGIPSCFAFNCVRVLQHLRYLSTDPFAGKECRVLSMMIVDGRKALIGSNTGR